MIMPKSCAHNLIWRHSIRPGCGIPTAISVPEADFRHRRYQLLPLLVLGSRLVCFHEPEGIRPVL